MAMSGVGVGALLSEEGGGRNNQHYVGVGREACEKEGRKGSGVRRGAIVAILPFIAPPPTIVIALFSSIAIAPPPIVPPLPTIAIAAFTDH
jgi:hypothetical protein